VAATAAFHASESEEPGVSRVTQTRTAEQRAHERELRKLSRNSRWFVYSGVASSTNIPNGSRT
jgi:NADH:ubiquinone oxidoreductase subunit